MYMCVCLDEETIPSMTQSFQPQRRGCSVDVPFDSELNSVNRMNISSSRKNIRSDDEAVARGLPM